MKTVEVLAGLRGLDAQIFQTRKPEEVLLKWASDGVLSAPRFEGGEANWPAETIAEAAALDALIFNYGFSFDSVRAASQAVFVRARGGQYAKDLLLIIERESRPYPGAGALLPVYIPIVLCLIAYAKAKLGLPGDELTDIEVWATAEGLHFRKIKLDPSPEGIYPVMPERIVWRKDS